MYQIVLHTKNINTNISMQNLSVYKFIYIYNIFRNIIYFQEYLRHLKLLQRGEMLLKVKSGNQTQQYYL